jgi:hypothetical protein
MKKNFILIALILFTLNTCSLVIINNKLKEIEKKIIHEYNKREIIAYVTFNKGYLPDEVIEEILWLNEMYDRPNLQCVSSIKTESGFDPYAKGWSGERCYVQVMPSTAREEAPQMGYEYYDGIEFDPIFNVRFWFHYTKKLNKQFNGDEIKTFLAYNMGPGMLKKLLNLNYSIEQIKHIKYKSRGWKPYDEKVMSYLSFNVN